MSHTPPAEGKVGLMYMLAGGTDASNNGPHAAKPSSGNHWIKTGPHVMIVGAGADFHANYPEPLIRTPRCPTSCGQTRRTST